MNKKILFGIIGIIILLIVFWSLFYSSFGTTKRAQTALKEYVASQADIATYQVKDELYTFSCCAIGKEVTPKQANHVRFTVDVTKNSGEQTTLTVDFHNGDEDCEMELQFGSIKGCQRWDFSQVYAPGETLPPVIYSI